MQRVKTFSNITEQSQGSCLRDMLVSVFHKLFSSVGEEKIAGSRTETKSERMK